MVETGFSVSRGVGDMTSFPVSPNPIIPTGGE